MKNNFLRESAPSPDQLEINLFEQWLTHPLPCSYKNFLLSSNGGIPRVSLLKGEPDIFIQYFFSIGSRNNNVDLRRNIEIMRSDLPKNLIPIALAGGGDRLCLDLENGEILYWFHELREDELDDRREKFFFVATDISELLEKLQGEEGDGPEEDEVLKIGRLADKDLLHDFIARGNDINKLSSDGCGMVRKAAFDGNLDFIKECVKLGATLRDREILHAALLSMDVKLVEFLLDNGIDPNENDRNGASPLDKINPNNRGSAVQLLRERGASRSEAS